MPPTTPLRIGGVNYLNSKPLIHRLEGHAEALSDRFASLRGCTLRCDLPSRLADSLAEGRLEVGLVPAFEAFLNPACRIVSTACVASAGPVGSVKVYFRTAPADVKTLALDEGSRTSAALARLLLIQRHGVRPELLPLPIGSGLGAVEADATLLIGDRAMRPPALDEGPFAAEWDLATEWRRETGLPFVFAVWAAAPGVDRPAVAALLDACRDDGVARVRQIAAVESAPLGLTADQAERYLRDNLRFTLGPSEGRSLARFRRACRDAGLLPTTATERVSPTAR